MREPDRPEEVAEYNERSLSTLARAITLSSGNFALILVRCNYEVYSWQMWQRLQEITEAPLSELVLQKSLKTLLPTLLTAISSEQKSALVLFGLESVTALDQLLISTNQVRDEFRKSLTFPVVLWVTDEVLQKLTRFAPDFKSWAATSIRFELGTDKLLALWHQTADELFATILGSDMGEFLPNDILNLAPSCRRRQELESALRDLNFRNVRLEPALVATWQFILGRDAFSNDQIDIALQLYQQSLDFWQQELGTDLSVVSSQWSVAKEQRTTDNGQLTNGHLEHVGIVLQHIGLSYCRQAQLQRLQSRSNWEQARESFSASIEVFAAAGRADLVAQLTIQLGEVLQNLESWTDLQTLALHSLTQPQTQNSPVRLAQAFGFLAGVAFAQSDWEDAKDLATTAIGSLEQSQSPQPQLRGLYLLLSAKARRQLGELQEAVTDLEQAIQAETLLPYTSSDRASLQQQPQLYIYILEELRSLYLDQQQYLRAFELKQQQRSLEQQCGFCTFLGAAPLQPFTRQGRGVSPLEIAAAGRQADVNRLIQRLSRNDHKLTVIHGSSGVGKSSLIKAGLVPALEARTIGARQAMPIVQKVYRDWVGELARLLTEALASWNARRLNHSDEESRPSNLPYPFGKGNTSTVEISQPSSLQTILEQLRLCCERNLLTVLIFDQFEEFFFACTNLDERRQFYNFLVQCLNLPFLKVILSLREDYLHFLLECERYSNLNAINNNILERQLRYHLGDLSPEDAKNVICSLAARSQFQLEESLIEALVQDLAGSAEAVRLIELQVVGQQLQAEKITTLEQYQALGANPKASLVERSLLSVIGDCGQENEDSVWQVLFCLTDEKGTRPLKTKAELVSGQLSVVSYQWPVVSGYPKQRTMDSGLRTIDKLDLILKILVGSGLVFRLPEEPQDRYQLVHDYLVEPIRQKYEQRTQLNIAAHLEKSELELLRVQKQRLRAIAVGVLMAILAVTVGGLGWQAEVQRRLAATLSINAQLSAMSVSSEALFASNKKFDALIQGLRAARRLKEVETLEKSSLRVEPDTRIQVVTALEQAVYGTHERNRLEGHSDVVWSVKFSPDGQLIASASKDKTVKLWRPNGTLVTTLSAHQDSVSSVSFSPDSQRIASSSWDGTVRLWHRDGTPGATLRGHVGRVSSVTFSPNGQLIASAGSDRTIRLWTVDGKLVRTFRGHQDLVQSVSFSPDGQLIASASEDKTIKLWTPDGMLLQTLNGHEGKVNCVVFSPDGKTLASASDDRTVKLWNRTGKLLKTFPKHDGWVFEVAFSPDGQLIASASADKTVKVWNRKGALLKTYKGHSDNVTTVSFSPASRVSSQLSVVSGYPKQPTQDSGLRTSDNFILASASWDKTIKIWGGHAQSQVILRGHEDDVSDVTFSPDSQLIATTSNDKTVKIWNRKGSLLNTLRGHSDLVYSVSFSPDGQLIASASRDGTVRLWNRRGALIKTLTGNGGWMLNVSFSPDGERLVGASRDGTVKLWDRSGTLLKTLTNHRARVNAVSFSHDGQLMASASDDNTLKLWTADGTLLKTLQGHSNWVLDVSFSPDSQMLASASYDNTIKVWNRDGELIRTLKGHTDSVAHARFSPSGEILATTSWDNRVQLWRLDDMVIKTLEAPNDRVTSVSWSNDGKALAGASRDNTVIVWNLDLDDLLDKSCNWLQEYLQNNPKVKQSDRELCEPIQTPRNSRKRNKI